MYKLNPWGLIEKAEGEMKKVIPPDEGNTDYREYLEWVKQGNQPEPADPLPDPEPPRDDKIAALFDQGIVEVEAATTIAQIRGAHSKLLKGLKPLFMRGG